MFDTNAGRWVKTDLFGGTGAVTISDLLGQRAAKPFEAVLACELAPGGSVGKHHQESADEIVLCLEGHGAATVDAARTELVSGALAYVRLGATLSLQNLSESAPLRYLIVKTSAR